MEEKKPYRDPLADAEQRLYAKKEGFRARERSGFDPNPIKVRTDWSEKAIEEVMPESGRVNGVDISTDPGEATPILSQEGDVTNNIVKRKKFTPLVAFFMFSFIFMLGAIYAAYSKFYVDDRSVSADKIDLAISGPVTVRGGEPVEFQLQLTNMNPVPIEKASLEVIYPEGTRIASSIIEKIPRISKYVGDLDKNAMVKEIYRAAFLGEVGTEKVIQIVFQFRVSGSTAVFTKKLEHRVLLNSTPISVVVTVPNEANSSQEIESVIKVTNNTTEEVKDILLLVGYPPGFVYSDATPKPEKGNRLWKLGDLKAGAERKITISGAIEGEDGESKAFRVTAGVNLDPDGQKILVPYSEQIAALSINRSQIGLAIAVNGSNEKTVNIQSGNETNVEVSWVNNTPERIMDAEISVNISGNGLDKKTVSVDEGFYNSSNDMIVLTKRELPALASLEPGASGILKFKFLPINLDTVTVTNPSISVDVLATGRRVNDARNSLPLTAEVSRNLKVVSTANLSTTVAYSEGLITNYGPIPPRVGEETSYTITFNVVNRGSDIKSVKVKTTLPPYVKWGSVTLPASENIAYDEKSGQVVWSAGTIKAGSPGAEGRSVSFKVVFKPSLSQLGAIPALTGQIDLSAQDSFTGSALSDKAQPLPAKVNNETQFEKTPQTVSE